MENAFAPRKIRKAILQIRPALFLSFLLLALGNFSLFGMAAEAAEKEVLILHTNNVTGHLFPCPT